MCVVVLKKCCGIFTTLALYNLAILRCFLGVAQFRDSIIVVTLLLCAQYSCYIPILHFSSVFFPMS